MRYKLAIFDLDGTILDTLADIAAAVNYVLEKYGFNRKSEQEIKAFLGYGGKNLIACVIDGKVSPERFSAIYRDYIEYYSTHCDIKTIPYAGIYQMLVNLKEAGMKLAVISNKGDRQVNILIESHFKGLFDFAGGERKDIKRKPDKEAIVSVVRELGFEVSDCVYIGDSEVDLLTAENSGMDHIIVSYGFRDYQFLKEAGAKVILSDAGEIENYLLEKK
ncbi:MAG TPA: HAD family hydrolase [Erysipelotrichaceae bacterium]|nr:HAD family hydrolase [Erysipelotrichaceae bacterium]HQB31775.1 HAD family hydrolase [Erysipelotrichaceae bacterium]